VHTSDLDFTKVRINHITSQEATFNTISNQMQLSFVRNLGGHLLNPGTTITDRKNTFNDISLILSKLNLYKGKMYRLDNTDDRNYLKKTNIEITL